VIPDPCLCFWDILKMKKVFFLNIKNTIYFFLGLCKELQSSRRSFRLTNEKYEISFIFYGPLFHFRIQSTGPVNSGLATLQHSLPLSHWQVIKYKGMKKSAADQENQQ
jgi:hypothetical protein